MAADPDIRLGATSCGEFRHLAGGKFNVSQCLFLHWSGEVYSQTGWRPWPILSPDPPLGRLADTSIKDRPNYQGMNFKSAEIVYITSSFKLVYSTS